jgi:hypothetical protein
MDLPHHLRIHRLFLREEPTSHSTATHLKQEPQFFICTSVESKAPDRLRRFLSSIREPKSKLIV